MKKILMISYSFPPIKGIGTIRNYNIANQFQKYFEVKILSTKNRFKVTTENISVSNFNIKYLTTFDYKTLKSNLSKNKSTGGPSASPSKKLLFFRKLMRSFPMSLIFGEGGFIYIIHGFFVAQKSYKNGYKIIYSSFRPMADHYIAFLVKLIYKKSVWIADYRDPPYIKDENIFIFPKFQKYLIKKIISKANIVLTVSHGLKELYFDQHNNNAVVLRNGISNLLNQKTTNNTIAKKFSITYTGSLYFKKSNPALLFLALKNLIKKNKLNKSDLELTYAGNGGSLWLELCSKYNLEACANLKGFVSIQESLNLQLNSQINLLLSWSTKNQKGILTGKFYEYLNAKRPIILLINGEKDKEFEDIMKYLNAGIIQYNENTIAALENFILDKYLEWKKDGNVSSTINENRIKEYSWDYQFKSFYTKLKDII